MPAIPTWPGSAHAPQPGVIRETGLEHLQQLPGDGASGGELVFDAEQPQHQTHLVTVAREGESVEAKHGFSPESRSLE